MKDFFLRVAGCEFIQTDEARVLNAKFTTLNLITH